MPDHDETKLQKIGGMPGQGPDFREKSKNVGKCNRKAKARNAGETSATNLSGSYHPNLINDYDAVEIFNKVLHKRTGTKRDLPPSGSSRPEE